MNQRKVTFIKRHAYCSYSLKLNFSHNQPFETSSLTSEADDLESSCPFDSCFNLFCSGCSLDLILNKKKSKKIDNDIKFKFVCSQKWCISGFNSLFNYKLKAKI